MAQVVDLRSEISRLEQQAARKEDAFKREIKDYQEACHAALCNRQHT